MRDCWKSKAESGGCGKIKIPLCDFDPLRVTPNAFGIRHDASALVDLILCEDLSWLVLRAEPSSMRNLRSAFRRSGAFFSEAHDARITLFPTTF